MRGNRRLAYAASRRCRLGRAGGLAQATLITTYDYWGYYNISFSAAKCGTRKRRFRARFCCRCFLFDSLCADEPGCAASMRDAAAHVAESATMRVQLVAEIARSAFGTWAGYTIAALVM